MRDLHPLGAVVFADPRPPRSGTAALQEPWVAARTGLGPAALLRDLSILFADGRLVRGADAYRWVLRRLRWAFPLWLFAVLPPARWAFDLGYRVFARRRHQWSQVCGLGPRRWPPSGADQVGVEPLT